MSLHQELWSTCRYASLKTREAAKRLAQKHGSRYVSRGKKTISELSALARRLGFEGICLVFQKNESPFWVIQISILPSGEFHWGEKLQIDEYVEQSKA
jgi:rRNA maturation protein Rpf1